MEIENERRHAAEILRRMHEDPRYPIETWIEEVVAKHWREATFHPVLRLVCGRLGEAHAGKIIEYLTWRADPYWRVDREGYGPRHLVLATRCLAEVRNRLALTPTCEALLQEIVKAMSYSGWLSGWEAWPHELAEELPPVMEEVGPDWPGMERLRARFRVELQLLYEPFRAAFARMCLLGADDAFRRRLEALAVDGDFLTRKAIAEALAKDQPHVPSLDELLREQGIQDINSGRFDDPLEALVRRRPHDPEVRERLQNRARTDESARVRDEATSLLARTWPGEMAVCECLKERALQDDDKGVRWMAVNWLALNWPHEPGVRQLLKQLALQERAADMREKALDALARTWPYEPAVRDFLRQRALDDEDANMRHAALRRIMMTHEHEMDNAFWIALSYDFNFRSPLVSLREPLPAEHIRKAAEHFETSVEEMERRFAEYSRVLGWDLRQGFGHA